MAKRNAPDGLSISVEPQLTIRDLPVDESDPFRILVMGDFSGRDHRGVLESGQLLAQRRLIEVDRDNFDRVMERLGVELRGLLSSDGGPISLQFRELEDFHPDSIYGKVNHFASLRSLRRRLLNPSTFAAAEAEVVAWTTDSIDQHEDGPHQGEPEISAANLDDVLDRVLDESRSAAESSRHLTAGVDWKRLIGELVAPYRLPATGGRERELVGWVDRAAQATMLSILHHPSFQRLEALWRGLHLLISRLETDAHLRVLLLDVSKQELRQDLLEAEDLSHTGLYQLLAGNAAPWALLVGDFLLNGSDEDAGLAAGLARIARSQQAPFVAGAGDHVVGWSRTDQQWQPGSPNPAWDAVRSLTESAYIGLIWPRFLLRLPYGAAFRPTEQFAFEEVTGQPEQARLLWGNSAILAALLLAQSFAKSGWRLRPGIHSEVTNLPVWIYSDADGDQHAHPCGEQLLTDQATSHVASSGVMPLVSIPERDTVRIRDFLSLRGVPLAGPWQPRS